MFLPLRRNIVVVWRTPLPRERRAFRPPGFGGRKDQVAPPKSREGTWKSVAPDRATMARLSPRRANDRDPNRRLPRSHLFCQRYVPATATRLNNNTTASFPT